jgi:hypothetical protein
MLKNDFLKLYNYLPLRKLIKFELSFMYLRVSYGYKKPKSSPLYIFTVRPNFNEILPAVSDISCAAEGQRDKETSALILILRLNSQFSNIPPAKFVAIRCLRSRCHVINNSLDEAMFTL